MDRVLRAELYDVSPLQREMLDVLYGQGPVTGFGHVTGRRSSVAPPPAHMRALPAPERGGAHSDDCSGSFLRR